MMKWIFALLLIQTSAHASELLCIDILQNSQLVLKVNSFEASSSMSQKIRDNAHNYWEYVAKLKQQSPLQKLSQHQGLVVGDNHAGNFIFSLFNNEMKYFLADIKDSGIAPFIYDFNRLFLSTHASINKQYELKATDVGIRLLEHYISGLEGKQKPVLNLVDQKLKTPKDTYLNVYTDYVSGKYKKNKRVFKLKPGNLEALNSPALQAELNQVTRTIFPEAQILDYAVRPKERGGSKDLQRYWVLLENQNKIDILEFKEIGETAASRFGLSQIDSTRRYHMIMDVFWGERDPFYSVVEIGQKQFETRRKKVDVISVPYKQLNLNDVEYLLELASLSAYQTGVYHSRTATDLGNYIDGLKANKTEIIKAMKDLNKEYRTYLKSEIDAGRAVRSISINDNAGEF